MNHACRETVVAALALHLNVDPLAIEFAQHLEADWGLDALDIALLSLRLEELLDVEIPLTTLDDVRTVADLVTLTKLATAGAQDELGLAMAQNSLHARIRRRTRLQPARIKRRGRAEGRLSASSRRALPM